MKAKDTIVKFNFLLLLFLFIVGSKREIKKLSILHSGSAHIRNNFIPILPPKYFVLKSCTLRKYKSSVSVRKFTHSSTKQREIAVMYSSVEKATDAYFIIVSANDIKCNKDIVYRCVK